MRLTISQNFRPIIFRVSKNSEFLMLVAIRRLFRRPQRDYAQFDLFAGRAADFTKAALMGTRNAFVAEFVSPPEPAQSSP